MNEGVIKITISWSENAEIYRTYFEGYMCGVIDHACHSLGVECPERVEFTYSDDGNSVDISFYSVRAVGKKIDEFFGTNSETLINNSIGFWTTWLTS